MLSLKFMIVIVLHSSISQPKEFPKIKLVNPTTVEIEGYPTQNIMTRGNAPVIFWKCESGLLLKSEHIAGNTIVAIRKEFTYPIQIWAQSVIPRPDLGGVFFSPLFHNMDGRLDIGGEILFETFGKLCSMAALGRNKDDGAQAIQLWTPSSFGQKVFREEGQVLISWPNSGMYFVALRLHQPPKLGASFLVCNTQNCKQTIAYSEDRGYVEISYKDELIKVSFPNGRFPPIEASVQTDRSVTIKRLR